MHIAMRDSSRALNECLSLLSKLKYTSLTVRLYMCERITYFLLFQRTLLCAALAKHRLNESGYNPGIN